MSRINTNVASLRGLRSLQKANSLLDTSLTRLSTGLKINSGKDSPAGVIASETLRSQILSIEQSIKNSNRASNVISTADSALGEISGLLNQVRGLVQEGLNEGALSQEEIEANQMQIDAALSAINRISSNTAFAGDKLIDGSKAFNMRISAADSAEIEDYQVNQAVFGSSSNITISSTVNTAASKGTLVYGGGQLEEALTMEIGGSKGNEVLFFGSSSSIDQIATAINAVKDTTGVEAEVTTAAVKATLGITQGGDTLTFEEKNLKGPTVTINILSGSNNSGLSVGVVGFGTNAVTVNIETADAAGVISSTFGDIKTALEANAQTNSLFSVAHTDGTQVVTGAAAGDIGDTVARVDGELTLRSQDYGSDQFVNVNVLSGSFDTEDEDGNSALSDFGSDIVATINGQSALGKGLKAYVQTAALDAMISFDESANLAGTESAITVTGGGSLFQIGQEVSVGGQVGLGIEAVNTARLGGVSGKLYELGSNGGKSLLDVGGNVQGSDLVKIIEESLSRVTNLRGRLGAIQKNVIETNVSNLGVALENISEARSQIVDTDFAEETANLTRAQILSQAGLSVLGIANQNPSQVLSLLG